MGLPANTTPVPKSEFDRGETLGQPLTCRLDELRPHPAYVHLHLAVSPAKLSALAGQGELAFREPLVITQERIVIDGYARWELARMNGRLALPCVEHELTDEDALRWLLLRHGSSSGLNGFCRILLALELEPCLREKALLNQRLGGQKKSLSNLTKAESVNIRKEIAAAAGVAAGNVTKVRQMMRTAHPELLEALRSDEISIHRGWKWSRESLSVQIQALRSYQAERGVRKTIRDLISRHQQASPRMAFDVGSLAMLLSGLQPDEYTLVNVGVIPVPGKAIFVTEELAQFLQATRKSRSR